MRPAVVVLVAVLATACGSAEPADGPARYGISLEVPGGVSANVSRGTIRIATNDLSVVLHEFEPRAWNPAEEAYFNDEWPVRVKPADFERRPGTGDIGDARLVSVAGRFFSLGRADGDPAEVARQLEKLNEVLATIRVEPGDYFPGTVAPARFAPRSGWGVGEGGPADRYAHGEYVYAWAATITVRDQEANAHPPRRTLEALPPDGIVIQTVVARSPSLWAENALRAAPPYRLRDFVRRDCPGKACEVPEYALVAAYGDRYRVDIRVYFGQPRPTEAMLGEAGSMLAGLEFPDWGPWELEPR